MTEQEYDEQIAPLLADVAQKVMDMGGSMVARVEWEKDEAGITHIGITDQSGVGQRLTQLAALCRGDFDQLYIQAARRFDMSQTIVGNIVSRRESRQRPEADMAQFCSETIKAIQKLYQDVDGAHRIEIKPVSDHEPKGGEQDCDIASGGVEWVDQHGPGMAGDDFWGTVTWRLGDHYLIVHYAT